MSGTEMLKDEIDKLGKTRNQIAEALLEEFKDKSNGLEKAWEEKGFTIQKMMDSLTSYAREKLHGKSQAVDDDTVMGWVNHLIIDGEIGKTAEANSSESDDAEDLKAKPQFIKKTTFFKNKKEVDTGVEQLSLFDFQEGK